MTAHHNRKSSDEAQEVPKPDDVDAERDVDESEGEGIAGGARGVAVGSTIRGGGTGG